jgi:hypothetical protein
MAAGRAGGGGVGQGLPVETAFEDRIDTPIAERPHRERPSRRGLQPLGAVAAAETEDPETAAVALLGMGP